MRAIKFRAWDSVLGIYVYFKLDDYMAIQSFISYTGTFYIKLTIEQFTGLRDKNGKGIFEGDIVQTIGKHNNKAVVKYDAPSFKYAWTDGVTTIDNAVGWNDFEVTGNIHENPELLKL